MIESKDFTRDVIFANRAALAVRLGIFFTKECDITHKGTLAAELYYKKGPCFYYTPLRLRQDFCIWQIKLSRKKLEGAKTKIASSVVVRHPNSSCITQNFAF